MEALLETAKATNTVNRKIRKAVVLGSGVMGSRIALHFANVGLKVLLLDIVPNNLTDEQKQSKAARNSIVDGALANVLKANPNPVYNKEFVSRVTTGNFDDNFKDIADADLILEAVVENLEIKKKVFAQVDQYRKAGSVVASNTSGIPIHSMLEGRSEDFQKNFLGMHFFNPPRYLKLLEIIPTPKTDPQLVQFMLDYGMRVLGKTTVLCKDTPAFIANRIGVFSIMSIFHVMQEMGLTIEEVDALTGPITGKPKSATFRTTDVVGLDTMVKVATNAYNDLVNDESRDLFKIPGFVTKMVENNWLGDKSGQGFYKKLRGEAGKEILALDLNTLEYKPGTRPKFPSTEAAKPIDDLKERLRVLHAGKDKGADFLRTLVYRLSAYSSKRIPEIADEIYRVDDALRAGFGWELGPFETWDALGVEKIVTEMEAAGFAPAQWVKDMLAAGITSFYKVENGVRRYYDQNAKAYRAIPGQDAFIILDNLRGNKPIWKNAGTTLHDIGDGILNLEFHTKMNSMGSEVLEGVNKAIDIAEKSYRGLVIANNGQNFSAGANLAMIFMLAIEQEYDELDFAIRHFQRTVARARFSDIPVVVAPHGMTLGGGCELTMHADKVVAAAETYIGLVEVGVGLIPAGGGTKELTLRASDTYRKGDVQTNVLQASFVNIATAKVATSAWEAFDIDILRKGKDIVVVNQDRLIAEAKKEAIRLDELGYVRPIPREDVTVLGRTALGGLYSGSYGFHFGGYATEHDMKIANKLAYIMAGGDLSGESKVSEQYLLDLEREAFLSLVGEKKTLERIQSILKTGKPLRN
ncbi:MAG: 3-hydroxyacyl-CoA dehydrogenase NAD-binding domain-containing protein [Chitinophagales bacterium]|nr:3-hydroxyacyl-CoA dehydrogenase NAD-binding domain-containing protein [Chitinophagales bacterium]